MMILSFTERVLPVENEYITIFSLVALWICFWKSITAAVAG